jgi:hypothetical protein
MPLFRSAGVLATDWLGVMRGVDGGGGTAFVVTAAVSDLAWLLSLRRFGASLILG